MVRIILFAKRYRLALNVFSVISRAHMDAPHPAPLIVRAIVDLRALTSAWRASGERVALVPTMGALHDGHLSLIRLARLHSSKVVASVFVNPAQFGPGEDFEKYPRNEPGDAALLAAAGCDLIYAPPASAIYPAGFATTVTVTGLTDDLEGEIRPEHFAGVATVVAKLLSQCGPHVAVFGEKDYQQLQVIRRMVIDLDLPIEILPAPISRDVDGLALSSRNAYLTRGQRRIAPQLNHILRQAAEAVRAGRGIAAIEVEARQALVSAGFDAVDYVSVRGAEDFRALGPGPLCGPARILAVARLGSTRLLDNMAVDGRPLPGAERAQF